MLRYFEELAEAVDGRLMIYNIPATTHMSIPLEIADQLSKHHNIVGFKDSERNIDRMNEALKLWGSREDFSYFFGWAAKSADAILGGGDGLVPSTGNFHPALYQDLYQAARNGDETRARNFQKSSDTWGNLYQLGRTLGESLWALKVVMNEFGLCEPNVMPPIYAGSRADEKRIQETLQTILENQEINL